MAECINTRNYSQKTNFLCGSPTLKLLPFYVTNLTIPGITANVPEVSGRFGASNKFSAANITFNDLSLDVLLDQNYRIYIDIYNLIKVHIDDGTFENFYFEFWIQVTDDFGKTVFKIDFHDCQIETIGDLELGTQDETTERTFNINIKYDYYTIDLGKEIPNLEI